MLGHQVYESVLAYFAFCLASFLLSFLNAKFFVVIACIAFPNELIIFVFERSRVTFRCIDLFVRNWTDRRLRLRFCPELLKRTLLLLLIQLVSFELLSIRRRAGRVIRIIFVIRHRKVRIGRHASAHPVSFVFVGMIAMLIYAAFAAVSSGMHIQYTIVHLLRFFNISIK